MELHRALEKQSAQSALIVRTMSGQRIQLPETIDQAMCDICLERTTVLMLTCGEFICASCTRHAFDLASRDESFFPPKCCQRIPVSMALVFLDQELYDRYKKKAREFSTKDRIYCSVAECSEFISPLKASVSAEAENANVQCPRCESWTCVKCGGKEHPATRCPADLDSTEEEIMAKMATDLGWQRCRSCQRLVERVDGCHHIL